MTPHVHAWTADRARGRFVCTTCNVVGHRPSIIPGQHRTAAVGVIAYRCKFELDGRKHCGADAVHVTGDRQASRCAEHAPVKATRAA